MNQKIKIKPKVEDFEDKQYTEVTLNARASWSEIIPFFSPSVLILIGFLSERYYNNAMLPIWIAYVIIPIMDYILPHDNSNLIEAKLRVYEKDQRFLLPIYTAWASDFLIYFYALYICSIGQAPTSIPMFLLYCYFLANCGGLNLVIGHELAHRKQLIHKVLGNLVYAKMLYSHFIIQHIKSHHKKVATPDDPSTARKGESILQFFVRAIPEGYKETWELEKSRLQREKPARKSKSTFWVYWVSDFMLLPQYMVQNNGSVCGFNQQW
eukprot:403353059